MKLQWRLGIMAALFLAFCSLYPQLKMWYVKGDQWQGAYAYNDIDEVAYAAYLRALIDGRPRINDPYTGRDNSPSDPLPESFVSVQFAAPYSVAIPARLFGANITTAMWVSGAVAAFLAGLALFWFIDRVTGDSLWGMAGALVVVCGGALAAGEGAIGEMLGTGIAYPYFPGLRRYVPAMAFAAFFFLVLSVWSLLNTDDVKRRILLCFLSVVCFAYLVYSYFFIWTTAAAMLALLTALWLAIRPEGWLKDLKTLVFTGIGCVLSLIPYAMMLYNRPEASDNNVLLLVFTHKPDLWRVPELVSYAVIGMLVAAVLLKVIEIRDRRTIFALALALVPIAVFNHQIITGRSMQPIHYQVFIGNYVAALALMVTLGILWKGISDAKPVLSKVLATAFVLIAMAWGVVECHYTVSILDDANIARDGGMQLNKKLEELYKSEPVGRDGKRPVVLSYSLLHNDDMAANAPQAVLWARHMHVFPGTTWDENKERYYQFLYYMDLDEKWLEQSIKGGDFVSMIALFGWGRHTDRLNADAKPLTNQEIEEEAARFGEYIRKFEAGAANAVPLTYVAVPLDWNSEYRNLDRWYERDGGEVYGDYILYRVKPKAQQK